MTPVLLHRKDYTPEWRMSDEAMILLEDLIHSYKPKSILELGPGMSSWILHEYVKEYNALLTTVDHAGPFAEKHKKLLTEAEYDLSRHLIVPLGKRKFYDLKSLTPVLSFQYDLIVLDGPVEGRSSTDALEFYATVGRENTIWVIDDTHRPEERAIVAVLAKGATHIVIEIYDSCYPRSSTIVIPKPENWKRQV